MDMSIYLLPNPKQGLINQTSIEKKKTCNHSQVDQIQTYYQRGQHQSQVLNLT